MSAKFKFFLIMTSSIFATVPTVVYILHRKPTTELQSVGSEQSQQLSATVQANENAENTERANYKPIPLQNINSPLQGSDPADLAINAFDETEFTRVIRKVEVAYPQPNQAFVTITQTKQVKNSHSSAIKYRVELATFGRSLFVQPPRVWQIVWAGFQVQCLPGSNYRRSVPAKLFTRCMRREE
ncbi:MAG: hypothetical protein PUP93_08585 [Rhizonema sp. NSF051]|nr:hypothetical protein [Rhizonema sp. NSF051]